MTIRLFMTVLLGASLGTGAAHAKAPTGVWFLGGSVSESPSGYAGVVKSLPGASLGHGLAVRVSASGGRYEYDAGPTRIKADYGGGEAAMVYQLSGKWGWANVSAGPRFTHTSLSPDDPGNDLRGSRWDLGLQTDGAFDGAQWRLGWFGTFGVDKQAYQARLQLGRKLTSRSMRIGVEAGVQGDPSYKKALVGGFVATGSGRNIELQVAGGITEQKGRGPRAYGSLGLSRVF